MGPVRAFQTKEPACAEQYAAAPQRASSPRFHYSFPLPFRVWQRRQQER